MNLSQRRKAAAALGRRGGKARKKALTDKQLSAIGRKGAIAMHKKNGHRLTSA